MTPTAPPARGADSADAEIERLRARVTELEALLKECAEAGNELARRAGGTNVVVRQRALRAFHIAESTTSRPPEERT